MSICTTATAYSSSVRFFGSESGWFSTIGLSGYLSPRNLNHLRRLADAVGLVKKINGVAQKIPVRLEDALLLAVIGFLVIEIQIRLVDLADQIQVRAERISLG